MINALSYFGLNLSTNAETKIRYIEIMLDGLDDMRYANTRVQDQLCLENQFSHERIG